MPGALEYNYCRNPRVAHGMTLPARTPISAKQGYPGNKETYAMNMRIRFRVEDKNLLR